MENKLLPMQFVPTLHINKVTKEKATLNQYDLALGDVAKVASTGLC